MSGDILADLKDWLGQLVADKVILCGAMSESKPFISSRHLAATLTLAAFAAGHSPNAVAETAVAEDQDAARPTLADLMTLTQLRHNKLWYAARTQNWKLANYELDQFVKTVDRIVKLYPAASSVAQANLIHEKTDPALSDLSKAIRDRSNSQFEAAFQQITHACNECHQAAGVDFIVIQTPSASPFSNQDFFPH